MIAYLDCFSGISGDMILGAIVDSGVPLTKLKKELSCLKLKGYRLEAAKVIRGGLSATKVDVRIQNQEYRTGNTDTKKWKDIEKIIKKSTLSENIKKKGLLIFKRLFEAEAKVHGKKPQSVHLHELGAVDCIIDIFGTLIGLDMLGVDKLYSSPLNLGSGTVKTEHGLVPVPAPATAELLKSVPVYSSDIAHELTTPTGAVLVSTLAREFTLMPSMMISGIGVGAGSRDFKKQPNILRLFVGNERRTQTGGITVIETNIDDMNPQVYEYVMERLFKAGALDVFLTQIIMKKGRPGTKLTVLCPDEKKTALMDIVLSETTSIGLRFYNADRKTLDREINTIETEFGNINIKVSRSGKKIMKSIPEYEDCRKIAKRYKIPLVELLKAVSSSRKKQ